MGKIKEILTFRGPRELLHFSSKKSNLEREEAFETELLLRREVTEGQSSYGLPEVEPDPHFIPEVLASSEPSYAAPEPPKGRPAAIEGALRASESEEKTELIQPTSSSNPLDGSFVTVSGEAILGDSSHYIYVDGVFVHRADSEESATSYALELEAKDAILRSYRAIELETENPELVRDWWSSVDHSSLDSVLAASGASDYVGFSIRS